MHKFSTNRYGPCSKTCGCAGETGVRTRSPQCKMRACGLSTIAPTFGTNTNMQACTDAGLTQQLSDLTQPCNVPACATPKICQCGAQGECIRQGATQGLRVNAAPKCGPGTATTICQCKEQLLGANCVPTGQTRDVASGLCQGGCVSKTTPCGDCCGSSKVVLYQCQHSRSRTGPSAC